MTSAEKPATATHIGYLKLVLGKCSNIRSAFLINTSNFNNGPHFFEDYLSVYPVNFVTNPLTFLK